MYIKIRVTIHNASYRKYHILNLGVKIIDHNIGEIPWPISSTIY